ncbi:uncharacterized protein LOC125053691 [Pieris napi]|uniref:uncharacterized protein LOC125053691 n=1 Tax=Pieris napi TaxID=78633 RepID=UPI001FB9ABF4|nr:uncharacterized protein LOC125053691 [Pieris napi]
MRILLSILFVVLGSYGVLGALPLTCSCIPGLLKAKLGLSAPNAFMKHGITPRFLPVPPKDKLDSAFMTANVELGNFIDPLRTIDTKYIAYPHGKSDVNYTLFLVDFDGKQGPPPNAYLIGMYVNVPNSKNLLVGGDIAVPFIPPMPNIGTRIHRLAALLYEQNDHIDPDAMELMKLVKTRVIQLEQIAKKYNLKPEPVAGTFYTTELSLCGNIIH